MKKNIEFLNKCRTAAADAAEKCGWKVINCAEKGQPLSIDEIHKKIIEIVKELDMTIYLFLADGFEEVEAITTVDYLKRRAGLSVVTVGIGGRGVRRNSMIFVLQPTRPRTKSDSTTRLWELFFPEVCRSGTTNLEKSETVQKAIDFCVENNRLVAAICAAPSILGHKNLLYGLDATCCPGVEGECYGANIRKQRPVCCAKNFITGMSAGCATQFAAKIIEYFKGETVAQNVLSDVVWKV